MKNNGKKLHIVFLDFDDIKNPLLGGGQAKATLEVGKRLAKKGHRITVLCSRYPGYKDRKENGMFYKHIGIGTKNIRINNALYILSLPLFVLQLKADIIIECFTAPVSTLCSPLFTSIPVVALASSFEAERFTKLYHLPFDKIEKFGARLYKYALPYSNFIDEKLKKLNPQILTTIVPEGVEEEYFAIKKTTPKHILFLGRFDIGQKGIDLLLHAYAKTKNNLKLPLAIAGHGPDEAKIRQLITMLQLDNDVLMLGSTYGKKKMRILAESLFVALPSRDETFSCFALEALATGLPLATFDIGGLSWTNKSVSLRAKAFEVNEYANVLKKLTEKKRNEAMSKKARLFAKNYSWENVTNAYESFFFQVLLLEQEKTRANQIRLNII